MPMEERRADKANRQKAENKIAALKLGDKWAKPTNAGNGRVRLKHECGASVEGNELTLYALVHAGKVVAYDLTLDEGVAAAESVAASIAEAAEQAKRDAAARFDALPDEEKQAIYAKREARALEQIAKAQAALDEARAAAASLKNSGGPSPISQGNRKPIVKKGE